MNTYTYFVSGTHCASCKIYIEDTLKEFDLIKDAYVDLKNETLKIKTTSSQHPEDFAKILTGKIKSNGYIVALQKPVANKRDRGVFWKALPIGLGFLVLFFLLQRSGYLNIGLGGQATPVTALIVGLVASVSSCLAVVGGLVLSLSAKISQDNRSDTKTFLLFHGGRLVSFAVLGGVLGAIGAAIGINFTVTAILGIVASLVMVLLGFNLIGVLKQNRFTAPSGLFAKFKGIEHKTYAPLALGLATFFLPCGFTQSMQFVAISSGSFVSGLLIMLAFAVGTLPVLMLLSFGSATFAHGKHAPLFFHSAGVVVIGFGLFALLAGLAGLGIINPVFNL